MTTLPDGAAAKFQPPARPDFLKTARPVPRPRVEQPRRPQSAPGAGARTAAALTPTTANVAPPSVAPPINSTSATPETTVASGIVQALPIVSGYLPVAFALGVLTSAAGIPFFAGALMSIIVYAGSAQFVAVSLIGAAAPVWTIVLTTFVINFRHFLMSTAIAPKFQGWSRKHRILFGGQMTDETFAVLMNHLSLHPNTNRRHVFAVNLSAHLAWITGTVLGYKASAWLPDLKTIGMDFALPGMFIALIVLQLKDRWLAIAAAAAAATALLLEALGAGHLTVLIAATLSATIAASLESRWNS